LRYQAGALLFPRALAPALRDELWSKTFPLLAPDSEIADAAVRVAALGALRAQDLGLSDLRIEGAPVFFKHEERPLFVHPGKLRVHDPRPDELNRGRLKINLSFTLPPGAYATLVVRRILWFAVEGARPLVTKGASPRPPSSPKTKLDAAVGPGATASNERRPAGFLARQRARKEAKAARRAEHSNSSRKPRA